MVIGKLSELLVSGHGFLEAATTTSTSPRSPLDLWTGSTSKRYDLDGVGLAIVAAMDRSGDLRARCVVSNPIAIDRLSSSPECSDSDDEEEDYTFVTRRGPKNETFTKVFYDGGSTRRQTGSTPMAGIFSVAAASRLEAAGAKPASGFLSACDLCRKNLHGKDIFMYRGEKAFCSSECRASQMMMDERKEQCRVEASKSTVNASNSPYSRGQIFSTGIMAI